MVAPQPYHPDEEKVLRHILQALDEWVDGAEDDGSPDTLLGYVPLNRSRFRFHFADGSTIDVRLEAHAS